jgi:surfactin synthase thioesterase subunit
MNQRDVATSYSPATGRWLTPPEPGPDARFRLLLLAHAGGGAIAYRGWRALLPGEVDAQAVTLPGRLNRLSDPMPQHWDDLVEQLHAAVLATLDDRPYALFGHCLGALLAYRLTVRLEDEGESSPSLLGVSGWAPQGFFRAPENYDALPASTTIEWAQNLGVIPAEVRADPEMFELVMPPMLADFRIAAQYDDDGAVVDCPLVSYVGRSDRLRLEPEAMASWAGRSRNYVGHSEYEGDHFYITRHASIVASDFVRHLTRAVAA